MPRPPGPASECHVPHPGTSCEEPASLADRPAPGGGANSGDLTATGLAAMREPTRHPGGAYADHCLRCALRITVCRFSAHQGDAVSHVLKWSDAHWAVLDTDLADLLLDSRLLALRAILPERRTIAVVHPDEADGLLDALRGCSPAVSGDTCLLLAHEECWPLAQQLLRRSRLRPMQPPARLAAAPASPAWPWALPGPHAESARAARPDSSRLQPDRSRATERRDCHSPARSDSPPSAGGLGAAVNPGVDAGAQDLAAPSVAHAMGTPATRAPLPSQGAGLLRAQAVCEPASCAASSGVLPAPPPMLAHGSRP